MSEIEILITEDSLVEVITESSTIVEVSTAQPGPQGPKGENGDIALDAHVNDETPHPTYDDIVDLTLLFENGIV